MRALFIIIFQLYYFFVEYVFNDNVSRLNDKFLNVGYLNTVITSAFYTTLAEYNYKDFV